MSTYILVHGAWHGGWCWHKVVARLERAGHRALAPDLPGHGLDRTPPGQTTLDTLVASICRLIDAADGPVILVGHSFGGTVVTQAAELRPDRMARLVYVTAFVPQTGQNTSGMGRTDADSLLGAERVVAPDRKTVTVRPAALKPVFYGHCSDDDVALARALIVPEGAAGLTAAVTTSAANWGRLPKAYIECTDDRTVGVALQRRMAAAAGCEMLASLDTDHSPFFSMPDELTAALLRA